MGSIAPVFLGDSSIKWVPKARVLGLTVDHKFTWDAHVMDSFFIYLIFNNYSPKWRWLAVDIYRAAKRRGKYPTLATDTEVNSCFSIY